MKPRLLIRDAGAPVHTYDLMSAHSPRSSQSYRTCRAQTCWQKYSYCSAARTALREGAHVMPSEMRRNAHAALDASPVAASQRLTQCGAQQRTTGMTGCCACSERIPDKPSTCGLRLSRSPARPQPGSPAPRPRPRVQLPGASWESAAAWWKVICARRSCEARGLRGEQRGFVVSKHGGGCSRWRLPRAE